MENCLFKTTSTKENIDLDKFKGAHLSDLKHPDMADEKQFVFKYEKEINGLLKTLPAFKAQVEDLAQSFLLMHSHMSQLS